MAEVKPEGVQKQSRAIQTGYRTGLKKADYKKGPELGRRQTTRSLEVGSAEGVQKHTWDSLKE